MSFISAVKHFLKTHIIISLCAVAIVIGGGWWAYKTFTNTSGETRYVVAVAAKQTIVVSVTGTGQVSASNQLDIKPQVSGEIISVPVRNGQYVGAGTLIAEIDSTQAQKAVRDAQANLESSQIALQKLQKPASALTLTQAQNALANANDALVQWHSDSNTHITNAFLDAPDIMTGIHDVLYDTSQNKSQSNIDYYYNFIFRYNNLAPSYRTATVNDYDAAQSAYDKAFASYQSLGTSPSDAAIEQALTEAYVAIQATVKSVKSATAIIQLYSDTAKDQNQTVAASVTSAITVLNGYTSTLNNHLTTLLSDTDSLKQDKQNIVEKQQSLDEVNAGADALDVQSSQLSLTKAQNALQDAKNNLNDYYVRAPFAGTIATLPVKVHDYAGSSAIATLITQAKVAQLSLNEVDAAKIAIGDKATLTFDALPDLSLVGSVSEIDTVGTVSQGVVTYAVKISFETNDGHVKPGMSVSAAIQTDVHQNVLAVPGSAIKSQGTASYVQVFNPPLVGDTLGTTGIVSLVAPQQVPVTVGISSDTLTEILSGLKEGEQVVVRTITGSAQTTTQAPSLLNAIGGTRTTGGGGGAGATRALGR